MKKFMLVLAVCLFIPLSGYGDELTSEKKETIKKFLQITGAAQMGELVGNATAQQIINVYKKTQPDIDPKAFKIIEEEIISTFHEEFIEKESFYPLVYPIYHKHMTIEELKGLIKFYETPLGRKYVSVMPMLSKESMEAGKIWGQQIFPSAFQRINDRFKKEGIKFE